MVSIYVVDDERSIQESVQGVLEDEGYSVETFPDDKTFSARLKEKQPDLILLDIWLPGIDGMTILVDVKEKYPDIPVIMISGHAGIDSAVNCIKLGAADFMEKPISLETLLNTVEGVLKKKAPSADDSTDTKSRKDKSSLRVKSGSIVYEDGSSSQKTLKNNVVLNGTGLLSGRKTGIILSPADMYKGVVFQTLDGVDIKAHITSLQNYAGASESKLFTANSTVLVGANRYVKTVEHLLAALSMLGITNVLIKVDEEIPNFDGSATDFCDIIEQAGIVEQDVPRKIAVVRNKMGVGRVGADKKYIYVEPFDGFEIQMRVDYPAPIFEQKFTFNPEKQSFVDEIAPARSFNFFENIDLAQQSGQVGSGYLNSHIIIHDGKVINTELRFPDEFARHKILDLIGDFYLLGTPLRGRVVANMTSHGLNQSMANKIYVAGQKS